MTRRRTKRRAWRNVAAASQAGLMMSTVGLAVSAQAAPLATGTIIITGTAFPAGLGLGVASDPMDLQAMLWTPTIAFDAHEQPFAALATRVPTLANGDVKLVGDGLKITVHLKPHLRFSDGSPLTAQDMQFGLKVNLDPSIANTFGNDEIGGTAAPNAHTLVLTFGDTYGAYLAYALPPALPEAYLEKKYHTTDIHQIALAYRADSYTAPSDVFSGPYRIKSFTPGQRLTLEPNPYDVAYPDRSTRPTIEYVTTTKDPGTLARSLAAASSNADIAVGLGTSFLSTLKAASGYHTTVRPSLSVEHLELNMATPALRDIRVREALQFAIDKPAFVRALGLSSTNKVATSLIPVSSTYHDANIKVSAYSVAQAKSLLTRAGYATTLTSAGKHLSLNLAAPNDPTRQREADLLTKDFAAIGVTLIYKPASLSPNDQGGFYAPYVQGGVLATRNFDLALFDLHLGPDPATAASLFDPGRIPSAIQRGILNRNYTGITIEELAGLPEAAQASLNRASRKLGYDKLSITVNRLLPYIVLYDGAQVAAADSHVGHFNPAPQDEGAFWNSWQYTRQ